MVMPINKTDEIFHLNKTDIEYYSDNIENKTCSGVLLGKATLLRGENNLILPQETGLTNFSVAKIAYANKIITENSVNQIRCVRTTIFGTQNNIDYVSNSVDFPVNCSGECPDHCACAYTGKAAYEKAFLSKVN